MRVKGAVLAAVAVVVTLVASSAPAGAAGGPRWSGPDRFATAAAVAAANYGRGTTDVVVVSGTSAADALTAAPLAALRSAPLLLVTSSRLPDATRAQLVRLAPQRIWVVGGDAAVGAAVAGALAPYASQGVQRLEGRDRYATSAAIARQEFAGSTSEVFVASGEGFADALSGGAAAAALGAPLLLTSRDAVPAATLDALADIAPSRITVVGGTAVVSADVERQLSARWPGAVVRVAGADRYETSTRLVRDTWESAPDVLLASGASFPDALAAAALGMPVVLSRPDCLPPSVVAARSSLGTTAMTAVGGTTALGDAALGGSACR